MEVRPVQDEKVPSRFVMLLGIVTEVRLLQAEKAFAPKCVTLLGIITELRPLQPVKAPAPILVTLFGIVMEVILRQK